MDFPLCFAIVAWLFWCQHLYRWAHRKGFTVLHRLDQLAKQGQHARLEVLADRLQRHPQAHPNVRAAALRCRALARLCLGRPKEAQNDAYLALEWNPKAGRSYLVLAMTCWEREPQKALDALEQASKHRQRLGWKNIAQAISTFRGLALTCLHRGPEALACLDASPLSQRPPFQRYRARALALCGRYQEALTILRTLKEPDEYLTLSNFLICGQRPEESLFWVNRSLQERLSLEGLTLKGASLASLGRDREFDACMQQWLGVVTRPADFALRPAITQFGRRHLIAKPSQPTHWN
ncbi:hypothetical protein ABS71_05045 [bacterium SCN 62-11]|nr:hypothetical protein [Candidatus Eremiobacteraeota bacterium]ODT74964.1 MAG: hypothetical protein ABS71_05045 [bacterium SCN 62-11]